VLCPPDHRPAPREGQLLSVTVLPGGSGGRVVVEVVGEVDAFTAPLLEACLSSRSARRGLTELVVDLERVTFLGAAGISTLAQAHRRCRMRAARLVVRGSNRRVLRSLQLSGLSELVALEPPAVQSLRTSPREATRPRPRTRRTPTRRPQRVCR
jgi:anti-sigma B factor antagonist